MLFVPKCLQAGLEKPGVAKVLVELQQGPPDSGGAVSKPGQITSGLVALAYQDDFVMPGIWPS